MVGAPPPSPESEGNLKDMDAAEITLLIAIAFLLVVEFVLIFLKKRLLSHAVWDFNTKYPAASRWVMFGIGLLLGHWYW